MATEKSIKTTKNIERTIVIFEDFFKVEKIVSIEDPKKEPAYFLTYLHGEEAISHEVEGDALYAFLLQASSIVGDKNDL